MTSYCSGLEKEIMHFMQQYDPSVSAEILNDNETELQLKLSFSKKGYELYWTNGYDLFLNAVTSANSFLVPKVPHITEITCSELERTISGYSRILIFTDKKGKMSFVKDNTDLYHPTLNKLWDIVRQKHS